MKMQLIVTDDDLKEYEALSAKLMERYLKSNEPPSEDEKLMLDAQNAIDWLITFVKMGKYHS